MTTEEERAHVSELRAELAEIAERHARELREWFAGSSLVAEAQVWDDWLEDPYLEIVWGELLEALTPSHTQTTDPEDQAP